MTSMINAVAKCTLAELYYAVQQLHALAYKCTHSILMLDSGVGVYARCNNLYTVEHRDT